MRWGLLVCIAGAASLACLVNGILGRFGMASAWGLLMLLALGVGAAVSFVEDLRDER